MLIAVSGCLVILVLVSLCRWAESMPPQSSDWLIHKSTQATALIKDGEVLTLSNGIISRSFLARGGAFCTVEYRHQQTRQTFFRGISPEGNITLSGSQFDIGGCSGTPQQHYEFFTPDDFFANLTLNPNALRMKNYTILPPSKLFEWEAGRRNSPRSIDWPPKGLHLFVNFVPPSNASASLQGVVVTVHYEMYDSMPVLRKWISVSSEGPTSSKVIVDKLVMEMLRAPNFAPEKMTIIRQQNDNPIPFDQQVPPDLTALGGAGRQAQLWFQDPEYDQCCDQELHVGYTFYTFLKVGYGYNAAYGTTTGPGAIVDAGEHFASISLFEILHDSIDVERQGLAIRSLGKFLTPQLTENPIIFMITDISSTAAMRTAVDQAAETGIDYITVGFGAAGWCGMCFNQLRNTSFKTWFKAEVDYARAKGVEISGYTLMQHNGWGEEIPTEEQTLSSTGQRGPTACFATDWHASYRQAVLQFIHDTGMGGLETDGQYENIPCYDTTHDHHHNGIEGGWHYGIEATLNFNIALKSMGLYQTGADAYAFSGANFWNHADTDEFGHLPLWDQQTVGRMYIYDSTITRLTTSGSIGVGDLATSSKTCDRPRMACYDFILGSQIGMGTKAGFRAAKLWDPSDPDASLLKATIAKWNAFYSKWSAPRPSGDSGVLVAEMIHVRRPDSRSLEVVAHMTSDESAPDRAVAAFVNPTRRVLSDNVTIPLYYTGLGPGVRVIVTWQKVSTDAVEFTGPSSVHIIGHDGAGFTDIVVPVSLDASSYGMVLISTTTSDETVV